MQNRVQEVTQQLRARTWEDLPTPLRRGVTVLAVVQVALFLYALVDLIRRPNYQVRGRKFAWYPVLFANYVGPLSYLIIGRKRGATPPSSAE